MRNSVSLFLLVSLPVGAFAAFIPDEFDGTKLGRQWRWIDSTPPGSAATVSSGVLTMRSMAGSKFDWEDEKYCFIEQEAPSGTDWEIVTKINRFTPVKTAKKQQSNSVGIILRQDEKHWICAQLTLNDTGTSRIAEGRYRIDESAKSDATAADHRGITPFPDTRFSDMTKSTWLKLAKTRAGYTGYASLDGNEWMPITPLLRNPAEPKSGFFTKETLRLYHAGGSSAAGGSAEAEIDFLRISASQPLPQGYKDDDFSSPSLNTDTWAFYPGITPGTATVSEGILRMHAGDWQDHWQNRDTFMSLFQDAPLEGNWSLSIKCAPNDLKKYESWTGYGLEIWQDQNDWVMITCLRHSRGANSLQIACQSAKGKRFDQYNKDFPLLPAYLRIVKSGTRYMPMYSTDGKTWVGAPSGGYDIPEGLQNAQVRLFTKKVNDKSPDRPEVQIDYIKNEKVDLASDSLARTDVPLKWRALQQAQAETKQTRKPMMLFSYLPDVAACAKYDRQVFLDPRVRAILNKDYIPVRLDLRYHKDFAMQSGLYRAAIVVFLDADGKQIKTITAEPDADEFVKELLSLQKK